MKKLLHMTLVLALLLGLSACAKGGDNDAPPLYGTYHVAALVEAGAFSEELEELDGDTAFMLYKLADYDLEREDLKDCAVQRSAGATCEEAAVLVFTSADKAKTAKGALEDYVQGQIEANTDYRPAEIPKLEEALVDVRGETLLLAVANDREAVEQTLNG
ncbi:MAG: DUF4358 domain-containing protein [Lawsonibacter sp.]|jgi:hypothetical protein|nr:DUF4358 domain-containing protein [Lawsonibacter sp.]MCI9294081.1 DUF4358 domain-containing protein [Lawsonibacter sp.]MCI9655307.1 DUF4358 domain-containing protein [Lawsonibacter sp.]